MAPAHARGTKLGGAPGERVDMHPLTRSLGLFSLFALVGGCLGPNYRVSGAELARIAQQPRNQRGAVLRATEELSGGDIGDDDPATSARVAAVIARAATQENGDTVVRADPHVTRRARRLRRADVPPITLSASPRRREYGRGRNSVRPSETSGRTRSSGRGAGGTDIALLVVGAFAVVVSAGALALALTEGARYDGWLQLDGDHPLHLYRYHPRRPRTWVSVPVADVTPEIAEWADGALVDPDEGRVFRLGRAPLNRRGFALSASGSLGRLEALAEERVWGGGARIGIGGFPIQQLGAHLVTDIQGATGLLNIRFGGEFQAFVPAVGVANFGVYVEGGIMRAKRIEEARDFVEANPYYGGGSILQLELTTRMSFDIRGGVWVSNGNVYPTFGAGFSIF